jgi:hypothetical protein
MSEKSKFGSRNDTDERTTSPVPGTISDVLKKELEVQLSKIQKQVQKKKKKQKNKSKKILSKCVDRYTALTILLFVNEK